VEVGAVVVELGNPMGDALGYPLGVLVGGLVGDALGDAFGDALGDALGDKLGTAVTNVIGDGADVEGSSHAPAGTTTRLEPAGLSHSSTQVAPPVFSKNSTTTSF